MTDALLLDTDQRGHVSLAKFKKYAKRYVAQRDADGTITLTPATAVLTPLDVQVLDNEQFQELLRGAARAYDEKRAPLHVDMSEWLDQCQP